MPWHARGYFVSVALPSGNDFFGLICNGAAYFGDWVARGEKGEMDFGFFLLPTLIEQLCLDGDRPETPANIYETYLASLPCMHEFAYALSGDPWEQQRTALIALAIPVAIGQLQLSKCLLELAEVNVPEKFLKWFF